MNIACKEEIKVSVLVPVYGVEKYIEQCVRSLFSQTIKAGIEFIFVNDCTKDRSIEILKEVLLEYPERENQVKIIHHKTNLGLAVARATGVKAAKGEYLIHCDSDDWVEPEMYELMYEEAKKTDADIVGCDFYSEVGVLKKEFKQNFLMGSITSVKSILTGDPRLFSFLWLRMVRRDFYIKNQLFAPHDVTMLEDMILSIPMHLKARKCAYVSKSLYHYRTNTAGISKEINSKKIASSLRVLEILKAYCKDYPELTEAHKRAIIRFAQPLISNNEVYDPDKWREITKDIDYKLFKSFKSQIAAFFIRHHLDRINRIFILL